MILTSLVTNIPSSESVSTGQNTGTEAHMLAISTSMADKIMLMGEYQVGSNVGYVAARCSTSVASRQMEMHTTLQKLFSLAYHDEILTV